MKHLVLQDLPDLYPGLTRAGIEQVVRTFVDPPRGGGEGMASHLVVITPAIAARLAALTGADLARYIQGMHGAAAVVLGMWTPHGLPPSVAAVVSAVEALPE